MFTGRGQRSGPPKPRRREPPPGDDALGSRRLGIGRPIAVRHFTPLQLDQRRLGSPSLAGHLIGLPALVGRFALDAAGVDRGGRPAASVGTLALGGPLLL